MSLETAFRNGGIATLIRTVASLGRSVGFSYPAAAAG